MKRSTSRLYPATFHNIEINQYDLNLIRQDAINTLLDEQGCDVSRAWVTAVLAYLARNGHLKGPSNV